MVMTRQSAHIRIASARCAAAGYIQCRPSSLAATFSIVLLTPNGLLQRMQSAGSSSLIRRAVARLARKSICGCQRDHLLRAGALAQPALHAGVFDEFQRRAVGIVEQRAGRAGRHAGQAQRAAADIDADRAERRAFGQRDHVDRRRRDAMQFGQRKAQQVAPLADGAEGRGLLRRLRRARCRTASSPSASGSSVSMVATRRSRKSEAGKNGVGHRDGLRKPRDVVQRLCAQQEAHARRAIGECRRRSLRGRPA